MCKVDGNFTWKQVRCRWLEMDNFHVQRQKNFQFFVFSVASTLVELAFNHCQNFKRKSQLIFQDFHSGKMTFGYRRPKGLDRKCWNDFFLDLTHISQKHSTRKVFVLGHSVWCHRYYMKTSKSIVSLWWDELGSLGLRGISPTLNITATHPEHLTINATFFLLETRK